MSRDELIAMAREADPFGDDGRLVSLAVLLLAVLLLACGFALLGHFKASRAASYCRSQVAS